MAGEINERDLPRIFDAALRKSVKPMAAERVIWLVWNIDPTVGTDRRSGMIFTTKEEACAWRTGCGSNWRCSQITVKETDGE